VKGGAKGRLLPRATAASIDRARQNVPSELRALPNWVAGDRRAKKLADGTEKSSKIPLNPRPGAGNAASDAPATWASFDEATAFSLRCPHAFGVGVNLLGTAYVGLDLDHVIDTKTGEIAPLARELLDSLTPSYTERSPSGDGLRMFLRGAKPRGWPSQIKDAFGPGTQLEMYDGAGGRYLTVTGNFTTDEPLPIADATDADIAVLQRFVPPKHRNLNLTAPTKQTTPAPDGDDMERTRFVLDHVLPNPDAFAHEDWLRIVMALSSLGSEGQTLAQAWCSRGDKYNPAKDATERHCAGFRGAVTIATLFHVADNADPSWRDRCRNGPQSSAPTAQPAGASEPIVPPSTQASRAWPAPMGTAVRLGVLRELLDEVEHQTEADPAAITVDFLTRVGNVVGRGPHFHVSGDRHGCNLFTCIVGDTGQGRKGSSAAYPRRVLQVAAPDWAQACTKNGLSSGEGIIHAIRDPGPTGRVDKEGNPIVDPGVADKRLLAFETELARTLRSAARKENTLAPILRQAWEGGRLASLTKQPYSATDSHFSLLSHVTQMELRSLLSDEDLHGGTANRFLFIASRRQRQLPFGGHVANETLQHLGDRTAKAISAAAYYDDMSFTEAAFAVWPEMYARLQEDEAAPGIAGTLLARATAQARRLAMLFAIVDLSHEVDVAHLQAAAEVWRYHRDTVQLVFGASTGNRVADRVLAELRGTPAGIDRTKMHALFDRHVSAQEINEALFLLHRLGVARGERTPSGGRPRETWYAAGGM
jgi:hypothetical protein